MSTNLSCRQLSFLLPALAAGAAVTAALTFAAPGGALAQCAGSYHASGNSGLHGPVSANPVAHTGPSAPSGSTSPTSCATGGMTHTQGLHANFARAGLVSGGTTRHWSGHSTVNAHANLAKTVTTHQNLKTH